MFGGRIAVLRLSHRKERDKRLTTHVMLTARAFGASEVIYTGDKDEKLEEKIREVVKHWGGNFKVSYEADYKRVLREWKNSGGVICHLTMYGINVDECIKEIPKDKNILVVVGSEKVPRDVFDFADFNIAVGHQPHSEVAALAIFLDRLFDGKELYLEFKNALIRIIPMKKGKKVIKVSGFQSKA